MPDIGWTELLLIGIVTLIVVGPKDLPGMFRTLGRFTAKARGMAREFQRSMEEAADEAGVKDVSRDLRDMTSSKNLGLDKVADVAKAVDKYTPGSNTAKLAEVRAAAAEKARAAVKPKEPAKEPAKAAAKAPAKKAAAKKAPARKAAAKPTAKPAAKMPAAKPAPKAKT